MSFSERRRHERVSVDIHVYWGWAEDCPFQDRIISLSAGGYFLRTSQGAPRGTEIFVKFWLPDERTLGGEVRYQLEKWGVGVEFMGLGAEETARLEALVEHYRGLIPQ
jgi:hypothetical protein